MANFNITYNNTLTHEGGYVSPEVANKIGDSGGETYKGIARNPNPSWPGWKIIDEYKRGNSAWYTYSGVRYFGLKHGSYIPSKELDALHAKYIKTNFWDVNRLDEVKNQSLAQFLFDIGYGSGPGVAATHIQTVLGITADGKIGEKSIKAINSANQKSLFEKLQEFRLAWLERNLKHKSFYDVLVDRTNSFFFSEGLGIPS